MARFEVSCRTPHSPAEAWRRLTDWHAHARHVPLTTIEVRPAADHGVGTIFLARTGVGRLGFDDPMEVTLWQPPDDTGSGRCRLVKRGRVVLGSAELSVAPAGDRPNGGHDGPTIATWTEDIRVAHLPALADRATAASSRLLFGRVLRRLLEG